MASLLSDWLRRTWQWQGVIFGWLVSLLSSHNLLAEELNYACRRYELSEVTVIQSLDFSRDGKQLVVSAATAGSPDLYVINLLLPQTNSIPSKVTELGNRIMGECSRFSPDGRFVAAGAWEPTVDIWEVATGKLVNSFATDFIAINALAFSPNGELMAAGGMKGSKTDLGKDQLILFDFKKRQRLATVPVGSEATDLTQLIFSSDGRLIYGAESLDSLFVIDVEKRQVVRKWRGLDDDAKRPGVMGLSLSHDGKRLASGGGDSKVKIWEAQSGKLVRSFDEHDGEISSVAFSPDGKYVASGHARGPVQVREVETGRIVESLGGSGQNPVTFSPDGQWLAYGTVGSIHLKRVADFEFLTAPAARK